MAGNVRAFAGAGFLSLCSLGAFASCSLNSAPNFNYGGSDLAFGFTLLDPVAERVQENAYLVVTDGRIAAIGNGEPPQGPFRSRRDFTGLYALPGFVDAHAHITAGPATVERVSGTPVIKMESVDEITRYHARVALAFGVTTIRNPGGDPAANARYDERIREGAWVGPDAVHAGAPAQPPPFGGNAFVYPRTDAEWRAEARRQANLGMKYLKLYVSLREDELAMGIRAAHQHGLRAIAHLDAVSWTRAIELGIDDLTHALPTSADLLPAPSRATYLAERGKDSRFMYRWFELVDLDGPPVTKLIQLLAQAQTPDRSRERREAAAIEHDGMDGGGLRTRASRHAKGASVRQPIVSSRRAVDDWHRRIWRVARVRTGAPAAS
jgi:hypothetical protein